MATITIDYEEYKALEILCQKQKEAIEEFKRYGNVVVLDYRNDDNYELCYSRITSHVLREALGSIPIVKSENEISDFVKHELEKCEKSVKYAADNLEQALIEKNELLAKLSKIKKSFWYRFIKV